MGFYDNVILTTWLYMCFNCIALCKCGVIRSVFVTMWIFLSFLFRPLLPPHFMCWVIIAPVHTHWHTHFVGHPWMSDRPLATHNIHKRSLHVTGRIRTRIAKNQAAADLLLRPRGHRNWRVWSYKLESDIGSGYMIVKWILLLNRGRMCMCTLMECRHRTFKFCNQV